jgi:hypothetical protein
LSKIDLRQRGRGLLPFGPSGYKRGVPFRELLQGLVDGTPGARGAIFCDHEGEHVELALKAPPPAGCAEMSEWDLKICGAQLAATLLQIEEASQAMQAGAPRELRLTCGEGTLLCRLLPHQYYVLLVIAPGRAAARGSFALRETAQGVAAEM